MTPISTEHLIGQKLINYGRMAEDWVPGFLLSWPLQHRLQVHTISCLVFNMGPRDWTEILMCVKNMYLWASPQLHIRHLVHLHTCSVCLHECSCVHVCILIRTSMCRPEVDVRCHPQSLCTSLLIQSLFLDVNSLVPLDGLVTWFQVLPSPFPAVGLCAHASMHGIFCGLWQCKFSCLYGTTFQPEPRPSFWLEEGKMDWWE